MIHFWFSLSQGGFAMTLFGVNFLKVRPKITKKDEIFMIQNVQPQLNFTLWCFFDIKSDWSDDSFPDVFHNFLTIVFTYKNCWNLHTKPFSIVPQNPLLYILYNIIHNNCKFSALFFNIYWFLCEGALISLD